MGPMGPMPFYFYSHPSHVAGLLVLQTPLGDLGFHLGDEVC